MRWTMWHVYGSGFDVAGAEPEKIVSFLKAHEDALIAVYPNIAEDEYKEGVTYRALLHDDACDPEEVVEAFENFDYLYGCGSAASFVVAIMRRETGIGFFFPGTTDDGECCVLFSDKAPWEYNDVEKELTYDSLKAIIDKYAEEIGVEAGMDIDLVYAG